MIIIWEWLVNRTERQGSWGRPIINITARGGRKMIWKKQINECFCSFSFGKYQVVFDSLNALTEKPSQYHILKNIVNSYFWIYFVMLIFSSKKYLHVLFCPPGISKSDTKRPISNKVIHGLNPNNKKSIILTDNMYAGIYLPTNN